MSLLLIAVWISHDANKQLSDLLSPRSLMMRYERIPLPDRQIHTVLRLLSLTICIVVCAELLLDYVTEGTPRQWTT